MVTLLIKHIKEGEPVASITLGPYRIETLIAEEEELTMTAYRVTIVPGQWTTTSYHKNAEEIYYVLEGHGQARVDGSDCRIAKGDFLRLPPGTRHAFLAEGGPLVLLDIHSPGSRPGKDVFFEGQPPPGFWGTNT